jgi:hypothetical protein
MAGGELFMRRSAALILLTTIALAACQSNQPTVRQIALSPEDIDNLRADRDARRISYAEWAERTGAAARMGMQLSPIEDEAIQHRLELAHRVDAGLMTPEQFEVENALALQRVRAGKANTVKTSG